MSRTISSLVRGAIDIRLCRGLVEGEERGAALACLLLWHSSASAVANSRHGNRGGATELWTGVSRSNMYRFMLKMRPLEVALNAHVIPSTFGRPRHRWLGRRFNRPAVARAARPGATLIRNAAACYHHGMPHFIMALFANTSFGRVDGQTMGLSNPLIFFPKQPIPARRKVLSSALDWSLVISVGSERASADEQSRGHLNPRGPLHSPITLLAAPTMPEPKPTRFFRISTDFYFLLAPIWCTLSLFVILMFVTC